jgi:hypothetical protein
MLILLFWVRLLVCKTGGTQLVFFIEAVAVHRARALTAVMTARRTAAVPRDAVGFEATAAASLVTQIAAGIAIFADVFLAPITKAQAVTVCDVIAFSTSTARPVFHRDVRTVGVVVLEDRANQNKCIGDASILQCR